MEGRGGPPSPLCIIIQTLKLYKHAQAAPQSLPPSLPPFLPRLCSSQGQATPPASPASQPILSRLPLPHPLQGLHSRRADILRAAQALDLLFDANETAGSVVPLAEFHNRALSEAANLKEEYLVRSVGREGRGGEGDGSEGTVRPLTWKESWLWIMNDQ